MRRLLWVLSLVWASGSYAQEGAVGYVKTLTGSAWITNQSNKAQAQIGSPVFQGSMLKTGANSSLGVTLKDDTVLSFGSDTEFTLDDYAFAPSQGKLKLGSTLAKGSMNYISGVIAKLQPKSVSVTTPSGTIGIRGTQFAVKVEDDE